MTEEEAQKRVDDLWSAIFQNEEENTFMRQEIDELLKKFPVLE